MFPKSDCCEKRGKGTSKSMAVAKEMGVTVKVDSKGAKNSEEACRMLKASQEKDRN